MRRINDGLSEDEVFYKGCLGRSNKKLYTFRNETHTAKEWSRILGITIGAFKYRLRHGYTEEQLFDKCESERNKYTYMGRTHTVNEWAKILNVSRRTIQRRIQSGLPKNKVFYKGRLPTNVKR